MASSFFERGREALAGSSDWGGDTIKAQAIRLTTTDTGIKAITAASNATPIVITSNSHGFSNGDLILIGKVGGNLAANTIVKAANVAANTFECTDPVTGANIVGSAAYTSGGYALCLGPSASGDFMDDFDGALVGTAVTLAGKTNVGGVLDANDVTLTGIPQSSTEVEAIIIWKDTGSMASSIPLIIHDGKHTVVCAADAAASATTMFVERLSAGIPNGTVLTFTNGKSATLSALANAGDRSITVSALANSIAAGSRADSVQTSSGLPFAPNGNDVVNSWDNGVNRIAKI